MERRQVDLGLVEILEAVRRDERARGPHRSAVSWKRPPKKERRPTARPGRRERLSKKQGRRRR
jgi:hypothetical protein